VELHGKDLTKAKCKAIPGCCWDGKDSGLLRGAESAAELFSTLQNDAALDAERLDDSEKACANENEQCNPVTHEECCTGLRCNPHNYGFLCERVQSAETATE
jgi:hypothetical protein